jgi:hypothetical protein
VEDTDFFSVPCLGLHAYLLDEGVVGRCMRRKGGVGEKRSEWREFNLV